MKMRPTLIKIQCRRRESGTVRYTHDCRKFFMSSVDDNNKIVITKSLPMPSSPSLLLYFQFHMRLSILSIAHNAEPYTPHMP